MMIHEKLMSGQFLLDFNNERSGLLQAAAVTHQHHLQTPSSPIPALDIYSAYAYQQQLLKSHMPTANAIQQSTAAEVLDLSRRDSVETPSPYHMNSSFGSSSPVGSPNSLIAQQLQQSQILPAANLLYAAQAQAQQQAQTAIYPGLYYPNGVKQEHRTATQPVLQPAAPLIANDSILRASLSTAVNSSKHELDSPQQASPSAADSTSTSTNGNLVSLDPKSTRPFKAFPRDPLVIAANFAATDVLLGNPHVERYTEYRKRVLEQIRNSNGGSRTVTNPKMRRTASASGSIHEGSSSNTSENDDRHQEESSDCDSNFGHDHQTGADSKSIENSNNNTNSNCFSGPGVIVKDAAYYERRRKNNAAAKKSRDRRRIKEDELAIRAAYLERRKIELECENDALRSQLAALTSKRT